MLLNCSTTIGHQFRKSFHNILNQHRLKMKHALAGRVMKPVGQDIAKAVTSNGRVCQKRGFLYTVFVSENAP